MITRKRPRVMRARSPSGGKFNFLQMPRHGWDNDEECEASPPQMWRKGHKKGSRRSVIKYSKRYSWRKILCSNINYVCVAAPSTAALGFSIAIFCLSTHRTFYATRRNMFSQFSCLYTPPRMPPFPRSRPEKSFFRQSTN
jgi:hypothetical protein